MIFKIFTVTAVLLTGLAVQAAYRDIGNGGHGVFNGGVPIYSGVASAATLQSGYTSVSITGDAAKAIYETLDNNLANSFDPLAKYGSNISCFRVQENYRCEFSAKAEGTTKGSPRISNGGQ
jgi:hypothetical protein